MCCRLSIYAPPSDWPYVLELAGFTIAPQDDSYRRKLEPLPGHLRPCMVSVKMTDGHLAFQLSPNIGGHGAEDHVEQALAAMVMFETARALGERGNSRITQDSLMGLCATDNGDSTRLLGWYPDQPFLWSSLCYGFSLALERGLPSG